MPALVSSSFSNFHTVFRPCRWSDTHMAHVLPRPGHSQLKADLVPSHTSCTLQAGIAHALNECCPWTMTSLSPQASAGNGWPWWLVPVASSSVTVWYLQPWNLFVYWIACSMEDYGIIEEVCMIGTLGYASNKHSIVVTPYLAHTVRAANRYVTNICDFPVIMEEFMYSHIGVLIFVFFIGVSASFIITLSLIDLVFKSVISDCCLWIMVSTRINRPVKCL